MFGKQIVEASGSDGDHHDAHTPSSLNRKNGDGVIFSPDIRARPTTCQRQPCSKTKPLSVYIKPERSEEMMRERQAQLQRSQSIISITRYNDILAHLGLDVHLLLYGLRGITPKGRIIFASARFPSRKRTRCTKPTVGV